MIKRKVLRTRNVKLLVLDEADEMLSRGFKDQIYDVYRYLPPTQVRNIFFVSFYAKEIKIKPDIRLFLLVLPCHTKF